MMMKRERQRLMVMICLLACLPTSSSSLAQDGKVATVPVDVNFVYEMNLLPAGTFKVFATKSFGKVVKGAPYSATAITEHIQTLGDGNQIIRKNEAKVYRDSEGRTRLDQRLYAIGKWTAAGDAPQMTYINDPVSGYSYNLDPRTRTVRKNLNMKPVTLNQGVVWTDEKRIKAQEERIKEHQERVKEQAREREIRAKERAKEHEARVKEQSREREIRAKEHEARAKQRAKEHEARVKERAKEHEARVKENEARTKERTKEQEERNKEREVRMKEQMKEREVRMKEQKERIKEQTIERKERMKLIEKKVVRPVQVKERPLATVKTKTFTNDSPLKIQGSTGGKEISNPDNRKKIESLGKQTIEGVEVEGRRATRSIAAGEIGNTLPIEIIDESWHSTDLQVPVMTKHSDPRSGVTTYRLTNISRSEPQRGLFEVPADYTFKDEPMRKRTVTKPEAPKAPESMKKSEPAKPHEPTKKPEPPKAPALHL